jgi:hypothetical protein
MAPPTVTNFVPGVTAGNQPRGNHVSMMSATLVPASQSSTPVAGSNARMRLRRSCTTTPPPALTAASP